MKSTKQFFGRIMIISLLMGLNINGVSQVDTVYVSKTLKPLTWLNIPIVSVDDIKGSLHQYIDTTGLKNIPLNRLNNGFLVNLTDAFDDGNHIYKTYQYVGDGTTNDFPNDWNEVMLVNPWKPNIYIEAGRLVFYDNEYFICHTGHTSNASFDATEKLNFTSLLNDNDWKKDGNDLYSYADSTISIVNQKVGIGIKKDLNYELNLKGRIWMENDAESIIIGDSAGFALDKNSPRNSIFIGSEAGKKTTTGTDNIAIGANNTFTSNTTGGQNVAIGSSVLTNSTTASNNIAIGNFNLHQANMLTPAGDNNVAIGSGILGTNIGNNNIGIGERVLLLNTTGSYNIGLGYSALRINSTGNYNIAIGDSNLYYNDIGQINIAIGTGLLKESSTASNNIAIGSYNFQKGYMLAGTGDNNVAIGNNILSNNVGSHNIGIGDSTLFSNTTGMNNIGIGDSVLFSNSTGFGNIGISEYALSSNTTGVYNVAIGSNNLRNSTTASNNIAIGNSNLKNGNMLATTGKNNVAIGLNVLLENTARDNTGIGSNVLMANTTGKYNIGIGLDVLRANTIGENNLGMGQNALRSSTTGNNNIGIGPNTLYANDSGTGNVALGNAALQSNIGGVNNIGIGRWALNKNTNGNNNTGIGNQPLYNNSEGNNNIGIGSVSLNDNTVSSSNIAIGRNTLISYNKVLSADSKNIAIGSRVLLSDTAGISNTAIGFESLLLLKTNSSNNTTVGTNSLSNITNGNYNVAIGLDAGRFYGPKPGNPSVTGISKSVIIGGSARASANNRVNEIVIGVDAVGAGDSTVRIGNDLVKRIEGQVGWSITSDRRLKKNIESLDSGLDFILKLKPVSYIRINNPGEEIEFGFIAQDLKEILNQLGYENAGMVSGKETDTTFLSVRYADIIAPMVRSVQEINFELNDEIENSKKRELIIEDVLKRLEKLEQRE